MGKGKKKNKKNGKEEVLESTDSKCLDNEQVNSEDTSKMNQIEILEKDLEVYRKRCNQLELENKVLKDKLQESEKQRANLSSNNENCTMEIDCSSSTEARSFGTPEDSAGAASVQGGLHSHASDTRDNWETHADDREQSAAQFESMETYSGADHSWEDKFSLSSQPRSNAWNDESEQTKERQFSSYHQGEHSRVNNSYSNRNTGDQRDCKENVRGRRNYQQNSSNFKGYENRNSYGGRYSNYNDTKPERNKWGNNRNKQWNSRNKVVEKDGDLFAAPEDHSFAHCVAADLRMGSGIAVQFKQQFKRVDELMGQRKKVGQVAILQDNSRYIYYLITKRLSTGKPRMEDLEEALIDMRNHVKDHDVKNIAIPRIGCGLDRLDWKDVRSLLEKIFEDIEVSITMYNFTVERETTRKPSIYFKNQLMRLRDIARDTLHIFFGSECGYVDDAMKECDEKFRFSQDYKASTKNIGDALEFLKSNEIICVLIVKKHKSEPISYPALLKSLTNLKKIFVKHKYEYMGFSAFIDDNDDLIVPKILTLLKIIFAHVPSEVWICWPEELQHLYEEFTHTNSNP